MTIRLPPEIESRLRSEASRRGVDASEYACNLIAEHLPLSESDSNGDIEPPPVRGVVPLQQTREELFTQTVSVRVDDLPKWKPQVILGQRIIGEADGD